MCGGKRLHGIRDQFTGCQGIVHSTMSHDDAIAHTNGRHHHGGSSCGINSSLDCLSNFAQVHMTGDDLALGRYHADQRLFDLIFGKTGRIQKRPLRCAFNTLRNLFTDHFSAP